LQYWKEADNSYFLNEKRNLVLAKKAYHLNDDFFELLYPTDVNAENVDSFTDFLITILDSNDDFSKQNKNKAKAKLLSESYKSGWKISEILRDNLLNEARNYALTDPVLFQDYRGIFDILFPDFDLNLPSLEDKWVELYYNTHEFSENETSLDLMRLKPEMVLDDRGCMKTDVKHNLNDLYQAMDNFWTSYREIFMGLEMVYEVHIPSLPDSREDLYSYNGEELIRIKRDMVRGVLSVCRHPQLFMMSTVGEYLKADEEEKLNIAEKEENMDLQLLLIEHVEVRICVQQVLMELAKLAESQVV
jgi:hypothetical protein